MKLIITSLMMCLTLLVNAQLNMTLKSNVTFPGNGNDIWGYVAPDGSEYAVVGTTIGTRVYSLEDIENPIERIFIAGSNSTWRDMKQWGEYVYVTCDSGTDGLLIIDMTEAPETINYSFLKPEVNTFVHEGEGAATTFLDRCHNIYIDENGIIYLAGCQGRGVEYFDPNANPLNPEYIGSSYLTNYNNATDKVDTTFEYAHDAYVKGDTLFASEIYEGNLALYDISNKKDPILLGSVETTSDFTHNAWADPTNTYAFTTDERAEGFVDAYDVSDPTNIEFLDKFMPPGKAGTGTIPHNTHYFNGFLVTSWYTSGLIVIDANKPDNLIQVAAYDTYDGPDGGFSGCWGATPYLPSGIVLASDINSGLYVFDVDYVRACYLEGLVTEEGSGITIPNVSVNLMSDDDKDLASTLANGEYKTGQASSGTFMVEYSHPLYESQTAEVTLVNGEVTIQDIQLVAKPVYNINVLTIEDEFGNPLSNSQVFIRNEALNYTFKTDDSGNATGEVVAGEYDIYVGNWGYENVGLLSEEVSASADYTVQLKSGYMDDFIVDLGWTVINEEETNGFTGFWERAIPAPTYGDGTIYNPGTDAEGDLGNMAFVTENEIGGSSFSSDVDDGYTNLTSPAMDLTTYVNPQIEFRLWFSTGSGNSQPDDEIQVFIDNGISEVSVLNYSTSGETWTDLFSFNVADQIDITDNMKIRVRIGDQDDSGHIVEGGFDDFFVSGAPVHTIDSEIVDVKIYPQPANNKLYIRSDQSNLVRFDIIDILGKVVSSNRIEKSGLVEIEVRNLNSGSYFVRLTTEEGLTGTYKFQVIK